jgi:hypothetical protein
MSARILDVTAAQYHADPCERPSLSSSVAHTIVSRSALHAWSDHPRFGNHRPAATDAMSDGSIIHAMLLGSGPQLDVIEADNFRTKAAQELRDAAIEAGRLPVLARRYAELQLTVNALHVNLLEFGIDLQDGASEVPIEFETGGVLCRSMLDNLNHARGRIVDLKTITSADPRTCSRHAVDYGYDIQRAAYVQALEALKPELAGRVDFIFAFCEIEPPYAVVPLRASGQLRALGDSRWGRAVDTWKRCLETDVWPGYLTTVGELEPPPWAIIDEGGTL